VPIYVNETVMDKAAITPEEDMSEGVGDDKLKSSPFRDLIDGLNLDDFGEEN
jgi:bifunctional DNase/RNase